MSTLFGSFHFLQPAWLLLLPVVVFVAWLTGRRSGEQRVLARLADPALLPYLLDGAPNRSRFAPLALLASGLLATIALAGPAWDRQVQPLFAQRSAQVVAMSMSPHMLSRDVVPDRLSRARFKVRDLFAAHHDGLNGLVAYAGEAFVVAPLTSDARSVDDLLNALSPDTMPAEGDDPGRAIDQAVELIRHADVSGGSIVLVTDRADAGAVAAARRARAAGRRVSVLGVGTAQGAPIATGDGGFVKDASGNVVMAARDDTSLAAVAAAGGGRYVPIASGHEDTDALAAQVDDVAGAEAVAGAKGGEWQDRGPWFLLPLLPLLALVFRRGWLLVLVLALAFMPLVPGRAHADGIEDLFRTRDQQAANALASGDAKRAQSLAHSDALRGAAAYRAGDYAGASAALNGQQGAQAQYNLGNALAKQGRYDDAIAAYDRALGTDPSLDDAKANRKAVEDWLQQQKKQEQKKSGDNDKDGSKKPDKPGGSDQQGQQGDKQDNGQEGDQSKDGKDARDGSEGQKEGGEAGPQGKPGDKDRDDGKSAGDKQSPAGAPQGNADAKTAEQKAEAQKAQQALKERMDAALARGDANKDAKPTDHEVHDLGAEAPGDATQKLPQEVRQALQRVPDDPGGLLRRKFMLEYQRRHGVGPEE
ncbi:Ca-activated chloride channel family protein [Luteibacter rhizovicinus]|uniref:Ca-activated chloride channel family protein n=1 Tax=Luteibacter rhizovicinus TaxID=242606 RepID=A0A4R3YUC2_9GAMM|nr:tetratricopeptide repeat protein [Luteibacter rhizovicinus]TCV96006.1 Ca-activated chloride channel family protein [Luteibacter rhizovicinus]